MFKKILKYFLLPIRKVITKLVISDIITRDIEYNNLPINMAAQYIITEGVDGDYYEFGCFKGQSFIKAYNAINHYYNKWSKFERTYQAFSNKKLAQKAFEKMRLHKCRYYVFDSFKGLPAIEGKDENHPIFSEGRYDCSKSDFELNLKKNNIELKDVNILEGFYEDTLSSDLKKKYNMNKASIILIDCDLYNSAKIVLNFITDLIQDGTIIIFDDWFAYKGSPNKGEQLATKDWLLENKNIKLIPFARYGIYQQSFIVHINEIK